MKIRQGFVTNSSSSSFIAKLKKEEGDYYDTENYAIRDVKKLIEYSNDSFGARVGIVTDGEDLDDLLNEDDSDDIKWLLNDYIEDKQGRPGHGEDIIAEIKKDLEKYDYIFIDADRSSVSGSFKDVIADYIDNNKIGEGIHYYCE